MKILTLNVRGLESTLEPKSSSQRYNEHMEKNGKFWDIIKTGCPELLCLTETKTAGTAGIRIRGYELVASRLARRAGGTNGRGSPSGGLAIYRKKTINLGSLTETLRLCQCRDVCETCRYFLGVEMKLEDVCFYLCLVYIPPQRRDTAPENNPFQVIQNVLNKVGQRYNLALITGDFNARTGTGWNGVGWNSRDKVRNPYGRLLNELSEYNGLERLNGTSEDGEGEFTCVRRLGSSLGGSSVVDYAFMKRGTREFPYDYDCDFQVMTNEPSADHRAILVTLKAVEAVVEPNLIAGGFGTPTRRTPTRRTPPNYHIQDYEDDVKDNYGDPAFDDDE